MAIDFSKFNEEFGGAEAIKATKEAANNEYKEVPEGHYTCKLEKLELSESKNGKPMVKGMLRIVAGEFKNQCLFVNQVCTPGFPMHKALEFLRSLDVFEVEEVTFTGDYSEFNDLILDCLEESDGTLYKVHSFEEKGYSRVEIEGVA